MGFLVQFNIALDAVTYCLTDGTREIKEETMIRVKGNSSLGEKLGLDDNRNLWENSFSEYLEVALLKTGC